MVKIIVVVEGGVVQSIYADNLNVEVGVLDYDNMDDPSITEQEKDDYENLQKEIGAMSLIYPDKVPFEPGG